MSCPKTNNEEANKAEVEQQDEYILFVAGQELGTIAEKKCTP
jgi:hypothetical protein